MSTSQTPKRKRGPYNKWRASSGALEYDGNPDAEVSISPPLKSSFGPQLKSPLEFSFEPTVNPSSVAPDMESSFAPPLKSFDEPLIEFEQPAASIDLCDIGSSETNLTQVSNDSSDNIVQDTYDSDEVSFLLQENQPMDEQVNMSALFSEKENYSSAYVPPVNDEQDNLMDSLLNELHCTMLQEKQNELNDEYEQVEDLLDHVSEFVLETTEYESDKNIEENCDPPIYDGSRRHLGVTILLLCCFMIRFRLSDEAMSYMISLFGFLLPDGNKLPKSLYAIRQFLKKHMSLPHIKYYCSWCYSNVEKDVKVCPNQYCMKDLTTPGALSYFILHSLTSQIGTLFKRKDFTDAVRNNRFAHYKKMKGTSNISDVYDGENYKKLYNSGFLNDENSLSFSLNTDGVPLFKSSKLSMWPVYLMINELPISQRKAKENVLFYGVWISTKKPIMWSFLKPLYNELKELESGIIVEDYKGNVIRSRATLLSVTCDLPAKCLVANCVQFNGKDSCWYCLQRGETFKIHEHGHCHVFPYQHDNPMGPPRTAASLKHDVNETVQKIKAGQKSYVTRGIKGPSWFLLLTYFNVIDGYVIDYMHGLCAGVMKTLLSYWFSKDHKSKAYSCFGQRNIVNNRLSKIQPTLNVNRVPRSLDDIVHWKSSEYRNFLLYWGVPVLRNILKEEYFLHFCLLVQASFLLCKDNITPDDIQIAEFSLLTFVKTCDVLYTPRILTMNFHQLVHLTRNVVANGPLFVNSCFIFEDFNGYLMQHIHGSQGVDTQIINTLNLVQTLPIMREKYLRDGTDEWCFYTTLMSKCPSNRTLLADDIFAIGKASFKNLTPDDYEEVCINFQMVNSCVKQFNKIYMKRGEFYIYGLDYKRLCKRNQSLVKYKSVKAEMKFGLVKYFAQFTDGSGVVRNVAFLYSCDQLTTLCSGALQVVSPNAQLSVVSIDNMISSCMYITVNNTSYVCELPNRYDID